MKCDCIKDLEKILLEKTINTNEKFVEGEAKCEVKNIAFTFNAEGTTPYQEFVVSQEYKTSNGKDRIRKTTMNVLFTYCPYCGRKLGE
ncbi:MAG: hypothetical protein ACRCVJ_01150 [Clostridium sp.]|uniref:hypothetical protein n=1 Tax=Clostridium sp. TaxID=1506 RepID=UPI003F2C3BB7